MKERGKRAFRILLYTVAGDIRKSVLSLSKGLHTLNTCDSYGIRTPTS